MKSKEDLLKTISILKTREQDLSERAIACRVDSNMAKQLFHLAVVDCSARRALEWAVSEEEGPLIL